MRKNKATLKDISKKTNVSTSSICMILKGNNIERFSQECINKVKKAAKELGYKANKQVNNMILVVCPSIFNPYYSKLIQAIDMKATEKGYSTMVYNTYWDYTRESDLKAIISNPKFCGIIFAMIPQQHSLATELNRVLPIVTIGDKIEGLELDSVIVNNFVSAELVAKHLKELNHENIAYISTSLNKDHSSRTNRLEGIKSIYPHVKVYSKDILPSTEINTVSIEYDTGFDLTNKCLDENKDITAIVAMNDMIAYGSINAIIQRGLKIPDDISICGFDNIFPSNLQGVSLTSVDHCIIEKGKKAVSLLLQSLRNEEDVTTAVEYKSRLIVRGSTKEIGPKN